MQPFLTIKTMYQGKNFEIAKEINKIMELGKWYIDRDKQVLHTSRINISDMICPLARVPIVLLADFQVLYHIHSEGLL